MKDIKLSYLALIILHALIALVVFFAPFLSKIYALLIPVIGIALVYKNKNKNNEVLYVSAYLVGVEVFLRMTGGNFNNEFVKFLVVFFMLMGMFYSNFSKNALIYMFFLILLMPGILMTIFNAGIETDMKKVLFFNLSGPVCLGIASI